MTIGTVANIVKAVGAIDYQSHARFEKIEAVEFDARLLTKGGLFVPLMGQTDGHDYIHQAIEKGATATFWSRKHQDPPEGICVIWVDDTLEALQKLAKWYLEQVHPTVIGITGSSGKTTTKDMTAAVLATKYEVYKTQGNFNNEIGLPKTILDMPATTQMLVLEMGMSEFGEISLLTQLAQPKIAVITLIGESHIEMLGSRSGIAQAKMEILEGVREGGTIIYPHEEPLLRHEISAKIGARNIQEKTFGCVQEADLCACDIHSQVAETHFKLSQFPNKTLSIPVLGAYNVQNAMAAILVGQACNITIEMAAEGLSHFQLTKNRTQWVEGVNGSRLLNDAYNASPIAMKSVLQAFSDLPVENTARRIAVLGDMRELGAQSVALHASVEEAILPEKIAQLFLFGPEMKALQEALMAAHKQIPIQYIKADKQELIQALKAYLRKDDLVLIKSSNGTGLLEVVEALKKK